MGHGCDACERTFVNFHAAAQHMNAVAHWECETCVRNFRTENSKCQHMYATDHWKPRYECEACDNQYLNPADARRHMEQYNHFRKFYCQDCEKGFQNENNLRIHLNSNIHRGSSIKCPFCTRPFTSATGVAHHLETSSCPNARILSRDTIYRELRKRDPGHLITKKLLTYPSSSNNSSDNRITPTQRCWNGSNYECYLCHREFGSLRALDQHVNSPAHAQKVYHCPGNRSSGCVKEFVSLAALFNHLESESCGAVRFETVQRNVGSFLTGGRLIGFV